MPSSLRQIVLLVQQLEGRGQLLKLGIEETWVNDVSVSLELTDSGRSYLISDRRMKRSLSIWSLWSEVNIVLRPGWLTKSLSSLMYLSGALLIQICLLFSVSRAVLFSRPYSFSSRCLVANFLTSSSAEKVPNMEVGLNLAELGLQSSALGSDAEHEVLDSVCQGHLVD